MISCPGTGAAAPAVPPRLTLCPAAPNHRVRPRKLRPPSSRSARECLFPGCCSGLPPPPDRCINRPHVLSLFHRRIRELRLPNMSRFSRKMPALCTRILSSSGKLVQRSSYAFSFRLPFWQMVVKPWFFGLAGQQQRHKHRGAIGLPEPGDDMPAPIALVLRMRRQKHLIETLERQLILDGRIISVYLQLGDVQIDAARHRKLFHTAGKPVKGADSCAETGICVELPF